jgi:hypothetical protein
MIPIKHSFRLVSKKELKRINFLKAIKKRQDFSREKAENKQKELEVELEKDSNKRAFLKFAGLVGVGALATTLIPKKAEALVFGSTPAASHVGVKDSTNTPIDPAKEGTLLDVKNNTSKLNNLSFTGDAPAPTNFLMTAPVDSNNNRISPATEQGLSNIGNSVNNQSIWMLRKIITLLKPLGMTTGAQSNRLSIDVNAITTLPTLSNVTTVSTVTTVSSITNLANIGNVNSFSLMKDSARNAYANSIRSKISF